MEEKSNIEKIDEQIKSIMNEEKDTKTTEKTNTSTKVEELDDVNDDEEDTKRIDNLEDIEENGEEIKKPKEETSQIEEKKEEETTKKIEENKESVDKEKQEKLPKKKKNTGLLIGIIIGILIIILILVFVFTNKKKTSSIEKEKVLSKQEQQEIIDDYGEALEGIVSVYLQKQQLLLEYDDAVKLINYDEKVVCEEHEIHKDGTAYLNKCQINNRKTKSSYGKKEEKEEEIIEEEDGIKVYVSKQSKKALLKEPSRIEDYDVYTFQIPDNYTDLTLLGNYDPSYVFYYDSDYNVHMLNFKTGEYALSPLNYSSVLPIEYNNEYDSSYVALLIHDKWGIYNLNTRERITQHIYDSVSPLLYMGTSGPTLSIKALESHKIAVVEDGKKGVIDYTNGKEIIPCIYNVMLKTGSYLWTEDEFNDGHIYDYQGIEYLKDEYDEIYGIVDGKYILVNKNDLIQLIQLNKKVLYDYGKLSLGKFNYAVSYNGALFSFQNPNGEVDSDCLEIIYNPDTKKGEVKDSFCGGIAKPILYLYPKKKTKVEVSFEHPEYLNTTYPKFTENWKVTAYPNGDLYDEKNNYYYGLYWDEKKTHSVDFKTGYYVEKENAIEFLEKKLDYIGLNKKEKNEFIMYWLPILERNEKSLVYFELTEERESYQKINITPKPDSLLRIVIHIKKVDKKIDIQKQSLTKFQRKGFSAVEWGGINYENK